MRRPRTLGGFHTSREDANAAAAEVEDMLRNNSRKHYQKPDHSTTKSASVWYNLKKLQRESPELLVVLICKLLNAFGYFTVSQLVTIFLTEEFHLNDKDAGTMYGIYGAAISIYGMILGKYVDMLGVRSSLQLGFALAVLSRISMAMTTSLSIIKLNLYILLPLSDALGIPVMAVAVRRLTNDETRGFAFGMFYVMMNAGGVFTGILIDYFGIAWKPSPWTPSFMTGNRMIMLSCALASVLGVVLSTFGLHSPQLRKGSSSEHGNSESSLHGIVTLFRDKSFLRFFSFSLIMVNLRSVFRHLDATLPKYLVRIHGDAVNKGMIFAINPVVIISVVPLLTASTAHMDAFNVIVVGAYISALSALYLSFSNGLWAAMMFVLQLSLGEALWSPRFLDYQVSVAPEGKEAVFMALANAPLFLSKLPAGYMSGYLLQHYCPFTPLCTPGATHCQEWIKAGAATCASTFCLECAAPYAGQCDATCKYCPQSLIAAGESCQDLLAECPPVRESHPQFMWFIITFVTLFSPILLTFLQRYIREPSSTTRHSSRREKVAQEELAALTAEQA
mmetsp:Transcript_413/g.968  ORF Transcript_413/g.968 Transcript_413/m.968 type:complete len:562 (-) Transcript_413:87-1772(-)